MSLFDNLVTEALTNVPDLSPLRMVVEKELLQHDIIRILSQNNLLTNLTFIGGTCLRACYGANRLSEDLDFTAGKDFTKDSLSSLGNIITKELEKKYGLDVNVTEPEREHSNVDTWKIKIETKKAQKHLPSQRINLDICSIPSYDKKPMMLLNPYGVDMGTSGLIIQAQSKEEIYTDKIIAFALRPNRIKYRDIWDIVWLNQHSIKPRIDFLLNKLKDRNKSKKEFMNLFIQRLEILENNKNIIVEFTKEMTRFLPSEVIKKTFDQELYLDYLITLFNEILKLIENIK